MSQILFQTATLKRLKEESARNKATLSNPGCPEEVLNQRILDILAGSETKEPETASGGTRAAPEETNPAAKVPDSDEEEFEKLLQEVALTQIGLYCCAHGLEGHNGASSSKESFRISPTKRNAYQLRARSIGEAISISTQNRDWDFLTSLTHPNTSG